MVVLTQNHPGIPMLLCKFIVEVFYCFQIKIIIKNILRYKTIFDYLALNKISQLILFFSNSSTILNLSES